MFEEVLLALILIQIVSFKYFSIKKISLVDLFIVLIYYLFSFKLNYVPKAIYKKIILDKNICSIRKYLKNTININCLNNIF